MANIVFSQNEEIIEKNIHNLDIILEFLKKSRVDSVGIVKCDFYSKLIGVFDLVLKNGFNIAFYTNGLWDSSFNDRLKKISPLRLKFAVRIDEFDNYSSDEWKKLENNIKNISEVDITIEFNIKNKDFEYNHIIDLIEKYKLKRTVKWKLDTSGLYKDKIDIYDKELLTKYKEYTDQIIKFATNADKYDISLISDCIIPLCIFNSEQLTKYKYVNLKNYIPNICCPSVDIGLDLQISQCNMPMNLFNVKITDFQSLEQITWFFNRKINKYFPEEHCKSCKNQKQNLCSGACRYYKHINYSDKTENNYRNTLINKVPFLVDKINCSKYPPYTWVKNTEIRLNKPMVIILELCDGKRDLSEIISIMAKNYNTEEKTIESNILYLIEYLYMAGLMNFTENSQCKGK